MAKSLIARWIVVWMAASCASEAHGQPLPPDRPAEVIGRSIRLICADPAAIAPRLTISGFVSDVRGRPIAGATIELVDFGFENRPVSRVAGTTRSDRDGAFTVESSLTDPMAWPTHARIEVSADGFARTILTNLPVQDTPYPVGMIVLFRRTPVVGTVQDTNEQPIEGALVHIDYADAWLDETAFLDRTIDVRTDEHGRFRCDDLPLGWFRIGVEADGFADVVSESFEVTADGSDPIEITMHGSEPMAGRVVDRNGRSIAGAAIRVSGEDPTDVSTGVESRAWFRRPVRTDSNGEYTLLGIADPQAISLAVSARGFVPRYVPTPPDESDDRAESMESSPKPDPIVLDESNVLLVRLDDADSQRIVCVAIHDDGFGEDEPWRYFDYLSAEVEVLTNHRWLIDCGALVRFGGRGIPRAIGVTLSSGASILLDAPVYGTPQRLPPDNVVFASSTIDLEATLIDANGLPLPNVCIEALGEGEIVRTSSDAAGVFRIPNTSEQRLALRLPKDSLGLVTSALDPLDSRPGMRRRIQAVPLPSVVGSVRIGGQRPSGPLPVALVDPVDSDTTLGAHPLCISQTNPDGSFHCVAARVGTMLVIPQDPRVPFASGARDFSEEFLRSPRERKRLTLHGELGSESRVDVFVDPD